jgi:heme exporter protein C
MHALANPLRFQRLIDLIRPWAVAALAIGLPIGLYWALVVAPADYQQGQSVRIMYVHVPAAWMALFVYLVMAVASASALIWKHPVAHVVAKASAPIGACFTAVALFSGSVWGKPMWGTWWVWDARLTSVLILFFLYLGYIALHEAFDDAERGARAASILAIVGVVNLPIIKFSVDWWNTLHQPASVLRLGGPTMDSSMLWPLLFMAVVFKAYYVVVLCFRVRGELMARRVEGLRLAQTVAAE